MPLFTIQNKKLSASVSTSGAELTSLRDSNYEFIWQAEKSVWPRHAPVLFPVVGKLKDNSYSHNGSKFDLLQHGFARDKEFALIHQDETSLEFELTASDETLGIYPFHFSLTVKYELKENVLIVSYTIFNPDNKTLFFSIGAHPGFNCKRIEGESLADYHLLFDSTKLTAQVLKDGLQSDSTYVVRNEGKKLDLNKELFENDAIVLKNGQVNVVKLVSAKTKPVIEMNCSGWPFFGIWTKKNNDDFVCLEPWYGIADKESTSGLLNEKEGIISLEPNRKFNSWYSIRVD